MPYRFVSLNGVLGVTSDDGESFYVVSPPRPSFDPLCSRPQEQFETEAYIFFIITFSLPSQLFAKYKREEAAAIIKLRDGLLNVRGVSVPIILLSSPLAFQVQVCQFVNNFLKGCEWALASIVANPFLSTSTDGDPTSPPPSVDLVKLELVSDSKTPQPLFPDNESDASTKRPKEEFFVKLEDQRAQDVAENVVQLNFYSLLLNLMRTKVYQAV